jgi:hypothetical protein
VALADRGRLVGEDGAGVIEVAHRGGVVAHRGVRLHEADEDLVLLLLLRPIDGASDDGLQALEERERALEVTLAARELGRRDEGRLHELGLPRAISTSSSSSTTGALCRSSSST